MLFYSVMRYDPRDPGNWANDLFVLSKGHAAPILYAAWAEAEAFPQEKLLTLRRIDSDFEGHPTPHLPFVEVATGSLGQGLSVGVGMAVAAKQLEGTDQRVYVLMGDGESAEGSVWEAAQWASLHRLDNLCATIDINRLGQSGPTMLQHHIETLMERWESFGWQVLAVDGHNIPELLATYEKARQTTHRPTVVLAKTLKGKGFPGIEDKEGWHGRVLDKETAARVIAVLEKQLEGSDAGWQPHLPDYQAKRPEWGPLAAVKPPYQMGGQEVSTRKAFGDALAALATADGRVVALDADVKNSTYADEFAAKAPERFFEGYIAEQNMTGMAMGLAARGRVAFASTFACFFTRAADFIRVAAISHLNVKLAGTHVGVSIGEDGPTQMGLEDLAMICAQPNFTCLYPSDATSAWQATRLIAEASGPGYVRLGRPNNPILYGPDEPFAIGKCKVLRRSEKDRALVVAGGVTVFEALKAYDELKKARIAVRVVDLFSVQPIDREELVASARAVGGLVVTVEDHYAHGGLGDSVLAVLAGERIKAVKLAVRTIARSGKPAELLDMCGISARHIVDAVRATIG